MFRVNLYIKIVLSKTQENSKLKTRYLKGITIEQIFIIFIEEIILSPLYSLTTLKSDYHTHSFYFTTIGIFIYFVFIYHYFLTIKKKLKTKIKRKYTYPDTCRCVSPQAGSFSEGSVF
jgi:hypothetical protein